MPRSPKLPRDAEQPSSPRAPAAGTSYCGSAFERATEPSGCWQKRPDFLDWKFASVLEGPTPRRAPRRIMTQRNSRFPRFYKSTVGERRTLVAESTGITHAEMAEALHGGGLDAEMADKFVENVLGTYALPFAVATNVRVNGRD